MNKPRNQFQQHQQKNARPRPLIKRPPTTDRRLYKSQPAVFNNNSTSRSPRTIRQMSPVSHSRSLINDPELISIRENLISSENPYDFSSVETPIMMRLYGHIREYSNVLAIRELYKEAREANELQEAIRCELACRSSVTGRNKSISEPTSAESVEEEWKKKFEEFDKDTEVKRSQLIERQQAKVDSFEQLWAEEMPRKYRKPSSKYLQWKKMERSLAISRDFDKAEILHKESEAIAESDLDQAQSQLNTDYKAAKSRLLEKNQADLENFEEFRNSSREILKVQYEDAKRKNEVKSYVAEQRKNPRLSRFQTSSLDHCEVSVESTIATKTMANDYLLPPLVPPNDPRYVEEEERRINQLRKRSNDFSKRNAEKTLFKWTGIPPSGPTVVSHEPVKIEDPEPICLGNQNNENTQSDENNESNESNKNSANSENNEDNKDTSDNNNNKDNNEVENGEEEEYKNEILETNIVQEIGQNLIDEAAQGTAVV